MGCDIHVFIEYKDKRTWKLASGYLDDGDNYISRNYSLFAMLANVRNGVGFTGCDTGNGFIPITVFLRDKSNDGVRGLPQDCSKRVSKKSDDWGVAGHSHSFFTLAELESLESKGYWDITTKHRGYVEESEYAEFKKNGVPTSWCGGVSGSSIRIISNSEMDTVLLTAMRLFGYPSPPQRFYTQIEWTETYRECATGMFRDIIPQLLAVAARNNLSHDDVRIVFWFDN